ncbi:hypothetical protein [Streptomyces sp. S.PB5]|uniref:hypothetical protein n=1 Tax=Streptomyces sp. S.PB5 TaxID=3020844 RepID=UPI0025B25094|nr:hypothetical protein [Streptomyces sp. S.PB5]MDN3021655.1 hypothetical protein [Streptomyces sp. S.PB5]
MKQWEDDEYCLHINSREGADLWSVLADWTQSEDEEEWRRHIPRFARLIACWQPLGFIRVFRSDEWPADRTGEEVTGAALTGLLADPVSWEYSEHPVEWICVTPGAREISELEDGMCAGDR